MASGFFGSNFFGSNFFGSHFFRITPTAAGAVGGGGVPIEWTLSRGRPMRIRILEDIPELDDEEASLLLTMLLELE